MARRLFGKRAIITGAATGIGKAVAEAYVKEGARLVIADINEEAGAATAEQLRSIAPDSVAFMRVNVRDIDDVGRLIEEATTWLGGLDVLVQNAGIQRAGAVVDFDVREWDELMAVNVRSMFVGAKHAIPHMRKAGRGSIINTGSVAGLRGGDGMTAYSASKGAVIAFSTALALELAPYNIRVNSVNPGVIDTPFNKPNIDYLGGREAQDVIIQHTVPLRRRGLPAEVAPLYVYLGSDESSYVTAQAFIVDGGMVN